MRHPTTATARTIRDAWRALWRNAHVGAAALEEPQPPMLVARQADPRADDDVRRTPAHRFEPQRVARREIDAGEVAAEAERRAQSTGPARQVAIADTRPVGAHEL